MKILLLLLALTIRNEKLGEVCDSASVWMQQKTGVKSEIKIRSYRKRGSTLDLYFTKTLSDFPWSREDVIWFRNLFRHEMPPGVKLGEMYCNSVKIGELTETFRVPDPKESRMMVHRIGAKAFPKGLDGRYIALWQSHGYYFDANAGVWKWQRAPVHRTVEDLFTQSFVLPFLIPMLENSGAYVMSPRERDTQLNEIIIDNDASFAEVRGPLVRKSGKYIERGTWSDAGTGFADKKETYSGNDNPFTMGSAHKAACSGTKATASANWSFDVPERGNYAVYVSYCSLEQSSRSAHYRVFHQGGVTEFEVDQTRGGGTWIYLGNFEFDDKGVVTLDNRGGSRFCVSADAVRIGGGMGKTDRGAGISGVPAYCEGALYSMLWNGIDKKVLTAHDSDYTNDFASRGPWVNYLRDEKHIPFDLSLAFHTDAGTMQKDSIVGTLAIYSLKKENKRTFESGQTRMANRRLAMLVQDEIVRDIRSNFNSEWTRREILDRSYSECRTPDVPSMLLELLSHQNFADMKYGHDPAFRFTVSRSVYKGILKFLSEYYGAPYTVQPLPVRGFSVLPASEGKAVLSWEPTPDPAEKSAVPSGYTVYTRIDDGAFDSGRDVEGTVVEIPVEKGKLYSFKIEAWNDGGRSFPSEILCYGEPAVQSGGRALIVNNFNKLSGPSFIDSDTIAGFNGRQDSGTAYVEDLSYIGQVYDFERTHKWINDDEAGFGASFRDYATRKVAGNTFDFVAIHARTILRSGHPVSSCSVKSFTSGSALTAFGLPAGTREPGNKVNGPMMPAAGPKAELAIIDIICGKEVDVWPDELKAAVRDATGAGVSLLLSGANVASALKDDRSGFAENVLGFRWRSGHPTPDGKIYGGMKILNTPNGHRYCVENPDALEGKSVVLRYNTGMLPAAVHFTGAGYKVAAYGFPLECLDSETDFERTLGKAIEFLK